MHEIKNISSVWMEFMRRGEFDKAWKFSDEVLRSGMNRDYINIPRHYQCIWDGRPLNGKKVLIRCYHGLGDTIQFIRYARKVREIASEVIVWAQPRLLDLLKTAKGIDRLIPLHDGVPEAEYDVDVEIMELPHIFRTNLSTIPSQVPYLHAEPMWRSQNHDVLSVGLVWNAGNWDRSRSIPFSFLTPLDTVEGIKIHILQADPSASGWKEEFGTLAPERNLNDLAHNIASLDLLISIDSMPAHLAGAMAVPVWVMLPAEADWRWMLNRTDSPWYPSMKLFRQEYQGSWKPLIEKVTSELRVLVSEKQII